MARGGILRQMHETKKKQMQNTKRKMQNYGVNSGNVPLRIVAVCADKNLLFTLRWKRYIVSVLSGGQQRAVPNAGRGDHWSPACNELARAVGGDVLDAPLVINSCRMMETKVPNNATMVRINNGYWYHTMTTGTACFHGASRTSPPTGNSAQTLQHHPYINA